MLACLPYIAPFATRPISASSVRHIQQPQWLQQTQMNNNNYNKTLRAQTTCLIGGCGGQMGRERHVEHSVGAANAPPPLCIYVLHVRCESGGEILLLARDFSLAVVWLRRINFRPHPAM